MRMNVGNGKEVGLVVALKYSCNTYGKVCGVSLQALLSRVGDVDEGSTQRVADETFDLGEPVPRKLEQITTNGDIQNVQQDL